MSNVPTNTLLQNALALHQEGHLQEAQDSYKAILELHPNDADALHLLGVTYFQQGILDTALVLISESLQINPLNCLAYTNIGNIFQQMGRNQDAVTCYDSAVSIDPGHADTYFNRGNSLYSLGRFDEALSSYDTAIVQVPDSAKTHNNRGNSLHELDRNEEAVASFDDAIGIDHDFAEAFFNRGVALQHLNRNEDALTSYNSAIRITPDYVEALNNRGNTLQSLDLYQNALASYHSAGSIDENYGDAHWNEALCLLKTGDFETGWKKYEWRWHNSLSNPEKLRFSRSAWLGKEDLHGKTILLHAEQGFGDTIQFCRYAKLVAGLGAEVDLEVHQSLAALMRGIDGVSNVVSVQDAQEYDYHCPLLSLPLAFGTRMATIPASSYYITSDPLLDRFWLDRFGEKRLPRIGIVWSGNKTNKNDFIRSAPLSQVATVMRTDIQWFSLQKELSLEDENFSDLHGIEHVGAELTTFSETAALINHMDLVITVDTAVAHLAAALGKPTWILLAHDADFRWLLGRRDSPWYPSVRLFRQPDSGDWNGLFETLKHHIDRHIETMPIINPLDQF
ncbi:MAG: tetratricopeptide repeat-containing glycosyltransferase family protein [Desulfuromonadales bacterium]